VVLPVEEVETVVEVEPVQEDGEEEVDEEEMEAEGQCIAILEVYNHLRIQFNLLLALN
jgi:hypothetical protein